MNPDIVTLILMSLTGGLGLVLGIIGGYTVSRQK